jgi:hypothetical protein
MHAVQALIRRLQRHVRALLTTDLPPTCSFLRQEEQLDHRVSGPGFGGQADPASHRMPDRTAPTIMSKSY